MKLINCLKLGIECELETISECIHNINIHANNIFPYSTIKEEMEELGNDCNELSTKTNFTKDSLAKDVLMWIEMENDGIVELVELKVVRDED